jgi:hypothetical protein
MRLAIADRPSDLSRLEYRLSQPIGLHGIKSAFIEFGKIVYALNAHKNLKVGGTKGRKPFF